MTKYEKIFNGLLTPIKVSNSLYNKLKRNQFINWYNPNNKITWDLIVTRKANNTIWFYLP